MIYLIIGAVFVVLCGVYIFAICVDTPQNIHFEDTEDDWNI